jgi:putative FmdB family regulatory protein
MPLYQYHCKKCNTTTDFFSKISEKPDFIICVCGEESGKILSASCVIGDEMPKWMRHPEVLGSLQNSAEKPIQSRSEYNRYIKQRGVEEISSGREI